MEYQRLQFWAAQQANLPPPPPTQDPSAGPGPSRTRTRTKRDTETTVTIKQNVVQKDASDDETASEEEEEEMPLQANEEVSTEAQQAALDVRFGVALLGIRAVPRRAPTRDAR